MVLAFGNQELKALVIPIQMYPDNRRKCLLLFRCDGECGFVTSSNGKDTNKTVVKHLPENGNLGAILAVCAVNHEIVDNCHEDGHGTKHCSNGDLGGKTD